MNHITILLKIYFLIALTFVSFQKFIAVDIYFTLQWSFDHWLLNVDCKKLWEKGEPPLLSTSSYLMHKKCNSFFFVKPKIDWPQRKQQNWSNSKRKKVCTRVNYCPFFPWESICNYFLDFFHSYKEVRSNRNYSRACFGKEETGYCNGSHYTRELYLCFQTSGGKKQCQDF